MGVEEDTLVQENIQEFVHDDNKIVTCKWLSLTLSIPVNSAKQALFEFVDKARNQGGNNDDINVTYFVSGFDQTEDGVKILKCIVVPESYLDSIKQSLNPVTSCHIYSVQKTQLKDYTPLYQADYDISRENIQSLNKFSPISCPWAEVREDQPVVKEDKRSPIKKSSTDVTSITSSSSSSSDVKKGNNKKGGIASMFAAVEKKEKKPEKESKSPPVKDSGEKKKGGIQSLFKNQPAGAKTTKEKEPNAKKEEPKSEQKTDASVSKKTEKTQKQKLSEKDEQQNQRKRRRIRNDLFDSSDEEKDKSDDDDDNEEEEEEEKAASPSKEDDDDDVKRGFEEKDEEPEPKKVAEMEADKAKVKGGEAKVGGKKRKRTRKLVPRQHIDEDGFMVTEKVWESDSTDASDQEEPPAKTTKSVSPAKASAPKPAAQNKKKTPATTSPSKNKQTSLMSFFKKK